MKELFHTCVNNNINKYVFLGWEEPDFNDQHLAAAGETFHNKFLTLWLLNAFHEKIYFPYLPFLFVVTGC